MGFQVEILLSTFNGEQYLSVQIDSLLAQSYINWCLVVRDDGSTDGTLNLINQYVASYPDKIKLLEDELGNLGASQPYSRLLNNSKAPYVALCDQDDYWIPEKLTMQMERMLYEENESGKDYSVLINTDLKVGDHELNVISESLWKYQNINPEKNASLRCLLVQNHITGCTCLINRALVKSVLPIAERAIMHDWWMALIAAASGKVVNMNTSTVLYRQHKRNTIGAIRWSLFYVLRSLFSASQHRQSLLNTCNQAKELLATGVFDNEDEVILRQYLNMFEQGWIKRRVSMIRGRYFKNGLTRNIAMFLLL